MSTYTPGHNYNQHIHSKNSCLRTEQRHPAHLKSYTIPYFIAKQHRTVSLNLGLGDHCHSVAYSPQILAENSIEKNSRHNTVIELPVIFYDSKKNPRLFCEKRDDLSKKHMAFMIDCVLKGGPIYREGDVFYHFKTLDTGEVYQLVFTLTLNPLNNLALDFEVKSAHTRKDFQVAHIMVPRNQMQLCDAIGQLISGYVTRLRAA